ncbi:MAG: hypothetical protein AB1630_03900 [bacterium]
MYVNLGNRKIKFLKGAKAAGQEYSGTYTFVACEMYSGIHHEVCPKEKALQCAACHFGGKTLDFKALGYPDDPMKTGGRFKKGGKP